MVEANRYDRQQRIKDWSQKKLLQAHIFVAGVGALGNELIKNLVLMGIGHILVVDFDQIELSNLSRTVLFRTNDIGRSKAQVATETALQLNPDVDIRYIHGNLFYDIGLGFYRHVDLVVSGLDNLAVRSQVGLSCALAGVPFLDGGMWALGGEVRWFIPGDGPCFECTLSKEDRERVHELHSCDGFRSQEQSFSTFPIPSTISTTAVIGGILAQEVVRYLCSWEVPQGEAIVYNGFTQSIHRTLLPNDPQCPYHYAYQNVVELESGMNKLSPNDLLKLAEKEFENSVILELGRDFLLGFYCKKCKQYEQVDEVLGRVEESRRICPKCGDVRESEIISYIDGSERYADQELKRFGIPPGEILTIKAKEQLRFYELTGDIKAFWE